MVNTKYEYKFNNINNKMKERISEEILVTIQFQKVKNKMKIIKDENDEKKMTK